MNVLEDVEWGDHVKIVADGDWKDLTGIVHKRSKDLLAIFCVTKPIYLYYVGSWNKNDIVKVNK